MTLHTLAARAALLAFGVSVGLFLAAGPAHALVLCQKEANPKKTKVREACKENEVAEAVNDVWIVEGEGAELLDGEGAVQVAAMPLPAGSYLIQATVRVTATVTELASCTLAGEEESDASGRLIEGNALVGDPHDIVLTVAEFIGEPTTVTVTCEATGGGDPGAIVQNARIVAQRVGRVGSPVF